MATSTAPQYGLLRFGVPDDSISVEDRGLYAFPANKEVKEQKFPLHDARTSSDILSGLKGLDAQGFAYIKHSSVLEASNSWLEENALEDKYLPELRDLVREVTGATAVVVIDSTFRVAPPVDQIDLDYVRRRGCPIDQRLAKLPKDIALGEFAEITGFSTHTAEIKCTVVGRGEDAAAIEPARQAHIDYTTQGLRDTVRFRRKDIYDAAKKALEAEDAVAQGARAEIPRYAAYSIWRPMKTVRRDPIAVCDARSVNLTDFHKTAYRALSNITENGEYHLEAAWLAPPKAESSSQRWYWMPDQKPDEVLFIKFADTKSDESPEIAFGCAHLSPVLPDTEHEETRKSLECRVIAVWD